MIYLLSLWNYYGRRNNLTKTSSGLEAMAVFTLGNDIILYLLYANVVIFYQLLAVFRGSSGVDSGVVSSGNCWLTRYGTITIMFVQIDNAIKLRLSWG